jgi:hypothetical protein
MTMMTTASDYLARLDVALRDVPHGVAAEIRAGIAEELSSLDPDAAEQRIAQLGDPAVIAREAMDAGGYVPPAPSAPAIAPAPVPLTHSRGFAIAAALVLSFGGFLVPFVGWVAGAVMVGLSGMWRTWEKVVAICAPLVLLGVVVLVSLTAFTTSAVEVHEASGTGSAPEVMNPLLPAVYDVSFSTIFVLALVAIPASGLWLLWRMRRRAAAS